MLITLTSELCEVVSLVLVISVNDAASSVLGEEAAGKGNKINKIVPGRKGLMVEMRARESKHIGFRSEY